MQIDLTEDSSDDEVIILPAKRGSISKGKRPISLLSPKCSEGVKKARTVPVVSPPAIVSTKNTGSQKNPREGPPKTCVVGGKFRVCNCPFQANGAPWYCYPRTLGLTEPTHPYRFKMFWSFRKKQDDPLNCKVPFEWILDDKGAIVLNTKVRDRVLAREARDRNLRM